MYMINRTDRVFVHVGHSFMTKHVLNSVTRIFRRNLLLTSLCCHVHFLIGVQKSYLSYDKKAIFG